MKQLTVAAKIWLSVGIFFLGYVLSAAVSSIQGLSAERELGLASQALFPAAQRSVEAESGFQTVVKRMSDAVLTQDQATFDKAGEEGTRVIASLNQIAGLSGLAQERADTARALTDSVTGYLRDANRVYSRIIADPSRMTAESQAMSELAARATRIQTSLADATMPLSHDLQEQLDRLTARSAQQRRFTLGCFAFTLLVAGIILGATIRNVERRLRAAVRDLADGAKQVAAAAAQVSSSSQSLARASSDQAASLEQTSASAEEINSMARRNSDNGHAASAEISKTSQVVADANTRLDQMSTSMKGIADSSNKISNIIKVIDEIAFQTNILALNAAVEAARAGETGMGFAVVADEVRNLAQRSAQAAKDTAALIEESIDKTTIGRQNFALVAEGIRTITASASEVQRLIDEVSAGSQEQARGLAQVAQAVSHMEQVTQTTSATAEESASAAEHLTAQSNGLNEIVRRLTAMVG